MADQDSTVPDTEVETQIPAEAVATETDEDQPQSLDGQETEGEGGDDEGEQEEEIEFDFGGNKFRAKKSAIPEDIAVELDKFAKGTWSDYTRKSQEVADQRKSVEAAHAAVQKFTKLNDETLNTYSRGLAVKEELAQLQKIDTQALWQSDPDQARRVSDAISKKQAEFNGIVNRVNQLEGQMGQAQQQETARRSDEGKQVLEKRIKGFTEKVPELIDYVSKQYGLSKDVAARWAESPMESEWAYKAMLYDRMQAQARKAAKAPPAPQPAAPVVPMRGKGGNGAKAPNDMSVSEMAKHLGLRN